MIINNGLTFRGEIFHIYSVHFCNFIGKVGFDSFKIDEVTHEGA